MTQHAQGGSQRGHDLLHLDDIPHRPPFLFVDEIVEVEERRILTRKFVDPQSDFFRGHYPNQPLMPGVLICEACFQSGALLIAFKTGPHGGPYDTGGSQDASQDIPVLTRITDARFKRVVKPGATLHIEVTLDEELDRAYFMTGRCSVDGKLAVRVTFVCMLVASDGPHGGPDKEEGEGA